MKSASAQRPDGSNPYRYAAKRQQAILQTLRGTGQVDAADLAAEFGVTAETLRKDLIALERLYGATNYDPLPVVLSRGEGVWLWDDEGRKYLDMLSAYSAVSFGYGHPRLLAALNNQAKRLAVTSRAFYSDRLPPFLAKLCEVTGMDRALPMSTGAEAVETAIKCARKWGYVVKKIPDGKAKIIDDGYERWEAQQHENKSNSAAAKSNGAATAKDVIATPATGKAGRQATHDAKQEAFRRKRAVTDAEKRVAKLDAERRELELEFAAPDLYDDPERVVDLQRRLDRNRIAGEEALAAWESAVEEIEARP